MRGGGPNPYPLIKIFIALLLATWHQLSDQSLVDSLQVRLDFILFTGFALGDKLPDESTFCRFHKRLQKMKLEQKLFDETNHHKQVFDSWELMTTYLAGHFQLATTHFTPLWQENLSG